MKKCDEDAHRFPDMTGVCECGLLARPKTIFDELPNVIPKGQGITQEELFKRFGEICSEMQSVMKNKNADYAGAGEAFTNFNQIELITKGQISREMGTVVRMTDKLSRVIRLLQKTNNVLDEKIEDTLLDLANYSILLIIMLEERKRANNKSS